MDGRQNHPRQQAEGVRLGLSQGAGGSDGCVDDGQNKQEGATENGAGEIVEVLFGTVSDQTFATCRVLHVGLFNASVPKVKSAPETRTERISAQSETTVTLIQFHGYISKG